MGVLMSNVNSVSALLFVILLLLTLGAYFMIENILILPAGILVALLLSSAVRIANQWEKAVILRLGKFQGLRGPGMFFVIPVLNTIPDVIDMRIITSTFTAEQTLTKDNGPSMSMECCSGRSRTRRRPL